jgi:DNA-binding MarR family transcriptional regulator
MPLLLIKDLPRYECLLEAAKTFPDLDPSACEVFLYLLRTGDEVFRVTDENLAAHHISQGRFSVLLLLLNKQAGCAQARTPAELADLCGVTRATMTGLIDTLERDGLVTREPDPVDRRMMLVNLTPRGHERLNEVLPGHFRRMAMLMAGLSEEERKTLVGLLLKILDRASAAGSRPPFAAANTPPAPAPAP